MCDDSVLTHHPVTLQWNHHLPIIKCLLPTAAEREYDNNIGSTLIQMQLDVIS